jgi:hypothetical protein
MCDERHAGLLRRSESRRVDADAPLEAPGGWPNREPVETVAKSGVPGLVLGLPEVHGSRLDLGDEGGRFPGGEVSPASGCVHHLGRVLDALSERSSAPERCLGESGAAGPQLGLGGAEVGLGAGKGPEERLDALSCRVECPPGDRDSFLGRWQVVRAAAGPGGLSREVPSLRNGGRVGAVVGEDLFEDVTGLAGFVGDDEDPVVIAAPAGGDVEAAVGGGSGDDADADVDGVALVALAGGGVAEPEMRSGVVGRERDLTVSVEM